MYSILVHAKRGNFLKKRHRWICVFYVEVGVPGDYYYPNMGHISNLTRDIGLV